jgi:hypothetical protein
MIYIHLYVASILLCGQSLINKLFKIQYNFTLIFMQDPGYNMF